MASTKSTSRMRRADRNSRTAGSHKVLSSASRSPVARSQLRIGVARMAADLGHALPDLGLHQADQAVDADLLEVGLPVPLAVEAAHVPHGRVLAERNRCRSASSRKEGQQERVPVDVVMRVEMCREATDELLEPVELPWRTAPQRCAASRPASGCPPVGEVHVQPHAERGQVLGQFGALRLAGIPTMRLALVSTPR